MLKSDMIPIRREFNMATYILIDKKPVKADTIIAAQFFENTDAYWGNSY